MLFLDWVWPRKKWWDTRLSETLGRPLPVAGFTVDISEYNTVYGWFQEKQDELANIQTILYPFGVAGSHSDFSEAESAVDLARNAHDLLKATTETIKRLNRENEQLLDQLGKGDTAKLEMQLRDTQTALADAREMIKKLTAEQIAKPPAKASRKKY